VIVIPGSKPIKACTCAATIIANAAAVVTMPNRAGAK
jgi:hypothetical protein